MRRGRTSNGRWRRYAAARVRARPLLLRPSPPPACGMRMLGLARARATPSRPHALTPHALTPSRPRPRVTHRRRRCRCRSCIAWPATRRRHSPVPGGRGPTEHRLARPVADVHLALRAIGRRSRAWLGTRGGAPHAGGRINEHVKRSPVIVNGTNLTAAELAADVPTLYLAQPTVSITMTTVGYGDIVPNPGARVMAASASRTATSPRTLRLDGRHARRAHPLPPPLGRVHHAHLQLEPPRRGVPHDRRPDDALPQLPERADGPQAARARVLRAAVEAHARLLRVGRHQQPAALARARRARSSTRVCSTACPFKGVEDIFVRQLVKFVTLDFYMPETSSARTTLARRCFSYSAASATSSPTTSSRRSLRCRPAPSSERLRSCSPSAAPRPSPPAPRAISSCCTGATSSPRSTITRRSRRSCTTLRGSGSSNATWPRRRSSRPTRSASACPTWGAGAGRRRWRRRSTSCSGGGGAE